MFGGHIFRICQYYSIFKVCNGEIKDLRNTTGLEREKFRWDYNQRATNKYLYSTANITRGTIMMAMGDYKVAYFIKKWSAYGDFIVIGRWYHENATKNFSKHFLFDRAIFEQRAYFPKIMFIYITEGNNILNQDIQRVDVYLPDFFSKQVGNHIGKFVFFLPISNTLKNLLTSKDNLLNEINPESANMFNPNDIFKIQQENLVKTAIEKYIKKLTVSFVRESYFLYDRSNLIEPTFITVINKFISIYGCISYFDKKSIVEIVELVSCNKSLTFSVIEDVARNPLEFKLTKIDGTIPRLNDRKIHNFSFTKVERKCAAMSNPIETVIVRRQQKFELYEVLNPLQIQINNDRILNTLKKHKNVYYKLTLISILFPSSVTNSTE